MSLEQKSREVALSFVNLDDVVFVREWSGNGMSMLALVGRSLVGTAAIGGGLAARGAFFGAQVAAKSAMAATAAARGLVPGAETAEQAMYELDQRIGMSAERASVIASRGVAIGKANDQPPTDPIVGDPWLGKRLEPGATWNTVLADCAVDLSKLAALPITLTTATMERAMTSEAGQRVGRQVWNSVSSLIDSTAPASTAGEPAGRADTRAMLLTIGATPLWLALQDAIDLGDGLSRAAVGDTRKLRRVLTRLTERVDASSAESATPAKTLAALERSDATDLSRFLNILSAIVEDGPALARLAGSYSAQLTKHLGGSLRSAMNAGSVDELEAWTAANGARGFFTASTVDLAQDIVFSRLAATLGREQALARVEHQFGPGVRDRIADDCSLRDDIVNAGRDRDRRIAALVDDLLKLGRDRLRAARDRAAARLATLTVSSRENLVERVVPHGTIERVTVLRRFVGMADTATALDGMPSEEPTRARVVEAFDAWIEAEPHSFSGPIPRPVLRKEAV